MRPFFLYILECSDGSYYVGHTDDLPTRLAQHEAGTSGGYTATRKPIRLAYSCEFTTREDALARERQIKNWSRAKKRALIAEDWEKLRELAKAKTPKQAPVGPSTSSDYMERPLLEM